MAESSVRRLGLVASLFVVCVSAVLAFAQPLSLAAVRAQVAEEFHDVPSISTAALAAALRGRRDDRPLVLDARERAEFDVSHVEGARWIDPDARRLPSGLSAAGRRVVVYCSVGVRSGYLARRLLASGVRDVRNLDGGLFTWAIEGRPMVSARGRATQVHPYDATWGRLLPAPLRAPSAPSNPPPR